MLEFVLDQLESSRGSWPLVAKKSGVSYSTLLKIAQRDIEDPGVSLVQRLHDYFKKNGVPA